MTATVRRLWVLLWFYQPGIAGEVNDAVVIGTSSKLGFVLLRQTLDQDALDTADHRLRDDLRQLVDTLLQSHQAFEPNFMRCIVA